MKKLYLIAFLALALTACAGKETAVPSPTALPLPTIANPTATLPAKTQVEQSEAWEKWSNGAHAESEDMLTCDACHQIQNGIAEKNIAWQNPETGQYEPVDDGSALCKKCHTNYESGTGAHANMTCLDCHDQHGVTASCYDCHQQLKDAILEVPATPVDGHPSGTMAFCEGSGCHATATQVAQMPPSVHGSVHANVACEACHDGAGLAVGPSGDGSEWVSWLSVDSNGETIQMPFMSHNIQFEVECSRCHFDQNPWGLAPVVGNELGN